MYKTLHTQACKYVLSALAAVLIMATLQGCLASHGSPDSSGVIAGKFSAAANSHIIAKSSDAEFIIPTDSEGRFSARVPSGIYSLHMQTSASSITLIRRGVQVDNNMTVTVLDTDIVPVPQINAVSVPLVYATSAIIEWETDIESDGYIEFGNNELYGYSSYATTELKMRHRIQLYSLQPATTYHFRVVASRYNLESARNISRNYTFSTEP